jgi:cell division protein FtsN
VIAATLETPPAVPAPKTEPRSIDTLKTDPTVRMQAVPKDAQAGAAQRELPAKADAASLVAPKVAQAPAPVKPAIATAPALMSKSATTATPAPKLITAAARTPSSSSAFYVQAGSYPTEARAGQAATALDSMGAHVMSGTADGHAVYRVRIGPFLNIRQANAAVEQAHALGHADLVIVTE